MPAVVLRSLQYHSKSAAVWQALRGQIRSVSAPARPTPFIATRAIVRCGDHTLICFDCVKVMASMSTGIVDIVVTSPPYNLGVRYSAYKDKRRMDDYLAWTREWLAQTRRVLKPDGSLFLNIAGAPSKPLVPFLVLEQALALGFVLQNSIVWVKSIYVPGALRTADVKQALSRKGSASERRVLLDKLCEQDGHAFGHFRPVNSKKYLNPTHEFIFHLTRGNTVLDRLAIGVAHADPQNRKRWKSGASKRCGGNVWFIPYPTRNHKLGHPATFPIEVPQRCIQLHAGDQAGQLVLDPFSGLASTSIAAARTGHRSIGIELDPAYHKAAAARLAREVGPDDALKDRRPSA